MPGLTSLLDRLREAYAAIADVETVLLTAPGDRFVLGNLDSLKRDVADLEEQWRQLSRVQQREVCRYRLLPSRGANYVLSSVSKSLLDFQELFSQAYDALKYGAKQRAVLSPGVSSETCFDFGFSFPGSLGIALLVDGQSGLLWDKYDSTIDSFVEILELRTQDEIRDLSHHLGAAVVKKAFDWAKVNSDAGYSIDLNWTTSSGKLKGGLIDTQAFTRIVDLISATSDQSHKRVDVAGVLIGIDAKTRRFRFVEFDGPDYVGYLAEDFPAGTAWSINTRYLAQISVDSVTEYATQTTKDTFQLKRLTDFSA